MLALTSLAASVCTKPVMGCCMCKRKMHFALVVVVVVIAFVAVVVMVVVVEGGSESEVGTNRLIYCLHCTRP